VFLYFHAFSCGNEYLLAIKREKISKQGSKFVFFKKFDMGIKYPKFYTDFKT
jgi:hypothetical protein